MASDVGCMIFKSMSLTEGVAVRTLSIVVRKKPYMSVYLSEAHYSLSKLSRSSFDMGILFWLFIIRHFAAIVYV